ncbi:MAG: TonB-dependent receptor [Gammaproteobacteria bacterium]|nr:TonB-dependent receptor [Gammaproteobacteria bacterium]
MSSKKLRRYLTIFLCLTATPLIGQDSALGPIEINVTRVGKSPAEIPAAVSSIGQDKIQLGSEQLGLDESLGRVPGLFMLNRYNFAQDLRASIRGFGARSSFGIRGIKIIVDGIPETLPDGQGSVDGIDIGSARQIDVIRGPASSLYGNASGGAILIESERGSAIPFVEARTTLGKFDLNKFQLKAGGETEELNYLINLSDTSTDGYREHSEFKNTQLNGRFEYTLSADSSLLTTLHHTDQPIANDAGGLTEAEVAADRSQARQRNLDFDAGEDLRQTRIGLLYKTSSNEDRDFEARIYNTDRDFSNRLPLASFPAFDGIGNGGSVFLDRRVIGGGLKYTIENDFANRQNRLLVGLDYDRQDDDRSRFDNLLGVVGSQQLEQNELVTSLGAYLQNETRLNETAELTVGLRYDEIEFDVTDTFLSDGDDSGNIEFDQISPMIGVSFKWGDDTHLYATISSAFETPTTTEFANPDGGGFNQSLEPQESMNYEIGIKTSPDNYQLEVAVFHIEVENELTPYEIDDRKYYENAGSSSRDGIELSYTRQLFEQINFSMAYTYSDFIFDRFTDEDGAVFDGKQIPGIPQDLLHIDFSWFADNGFYASWDTSYTGDLFADNANEASIASSSVSDIRFGHNGFHDEWEVASFLGVNNLFDEEYNNNIRINAFGARYFEPAPERNAYIGITIHRRFKS